MTEIKFGCGEFFPGTKRTPPPGGGGGGGDPPDLIAVDPRVPTPPPISVPPPPVEDFWVCTCTEVTTPMPPGDPGNTTTCDLATRKCIKQSLLPAGTPRSAQSFLTKQACENIGFGQEPCSVVLFKCYEYEKYCPEIQEFIWTKTCINCKNPTTGGNRFPGPNFGNGCIHPSIIECERQEECYDVDCPQPPPILDTPRPIDGPTTPDPRPRRPGNPNEKFRGPITPGGRRTPMWKCQQGLKRYCPPPNQTNVSATYSECQYVLNPPVNASRRDGWFDSQQECRESCYQRVVYSPCPIVIRDQTDLPGTITTFEPLPPDSLPLPEPDNNTGAVNRFGRLPGGPAILNNREDTSTISQILPGPLPRIFDGGSTTFEDTTRRRDEDTFRSPLGLENASFRSIVDNENILASINQSIINESLNEAKMFRTIDVENYYQSEFSDTSLSGQGDLYHPIYNIFNYEKTVFDSTQFVENDLRRDIFAELVSPEVKYLLENKNKEGEWSDKLALGLSHIKLIKSLRVDVYELFKSILDIDGQPLPADFFVSMIKRHLVYGTIDNLDMSYFSKLKDTQKERKHLELLKSQNNELNHRAALGLIANSGFSVDINKYSVIQDKIEAARQRHLLTDLETSVPVEVLDGTTLNIPLTDAGLSVSSLADVEEFVDVGPGDGYYFVIETLDGLEIPLELDTAVSASYAITPDVRKIALEMIGKNHYMNFTVSSSFNNSEFGADYNTNYTASAQYYKLELSSVTELPSDDNFVTVTFAKYVLLTDEDKIYEHSRTYGAKATQLNLQYDDPFIQYAQNNGSFNMSKNDITMKNFEGNRTSGSYSKIVRPMPQAIIINPTNNIEKNPFYVYSNLETITENQVSRRVFATPNFGLDKVQERRSPIPNKLTAFEENTYQLGLVGIKDTQNVYYPFDKSIYSEKFTVTKRSPEGEIFYNLLENTLKANYTFSYLTWWDVYRRLTMTEMTRFIYSVPQNFLASLEKGFKGYKIKPVLQRDLALFSDLKLKPEKEESKIVLTDRLRYKTTNIIA